MSTAKKGKKQSSFQFAANIRQIRKLSGELLGLRYPDGRAKALSSKALGVIIGSSSMPVDQSTVAHWETSGRVPIGSTIQRILDVFDLDEKSLLADEVQKLGHANQLRKIYLDRKIEEIESENPNIRVA